MTLSAENRSLSKSEIKALTKDGMDRFKINVCKLLQKRKISKAELGRRIDRDGDYIDYLINHPRPNPKYSSIIAVATALKTNIQSLFKK